MEQIHIKITDSIKLKSGVKQMTFNESGGYIGSGDECQWVVHDAFDTIKEKHIQIKLYDNHFCLVPQKNCHVYMNGDHSPIVTSYYLALNIGDFFKIGDIEFTVVQESELDDLAEETADNALDDIKDYNKLDKYAVVPNGQVEGFNAEEDISLDDLVNNNKDVLGIEETFENMEDNQVENYMMQNHIISRQVLKDFIIKECDNILNNEIKKQNNLLELLSQEKSKLSTKELSHIVSSFNLVNNTKIINLLVISMLFKELDSPFLNELEQDGFEKILSTFIKNASSDHNSIERLVVHAIKKYTGE